ncbi:MAG: hypothetical protein MSA09_06885 [Lachnospiraceae bacterium]|nr:hypothetical protein [Lachnospiraceae bacterium]MDD7178106.1 hypothetical protein [bacterium]MDY5516858.1 hypothetical protein [Lachnospiraceae bacterium]
MEKIIREIMDSGLLKYAIDAQLQEDSVYTKDMEDAKQLNLYIKKMISEEQSIVLDDYEAVMQSASSRAQEVSYILGVRDTIAYLQQMDALKIV